MANKIVQKTLEIIDYLDPVYYTIENPQTGYLKDQDFMESIPFDDVDVKLVEFVKFEKLRFDL